ncbi:unannotated protein [freshwater metagenome]|uniref:Unannotated protein n=1 Tax=freshwater metagenome TaxID=449393 RepID=A0A6J7CGV1_9ZZZZ|nr:sulfatase-like hydrolase/transferase [Actinomycetota bacterium]MSX81658.1 sulfatase-like hydrolase/transferase [Actinomycetota bacterium]MSZ28925.1 sulfatase-like hydrolase/transferase [Actinomycetota bacterium]
MTDHTESNPGPQSTSRFTKVVRRELRSFTELFAVSGIAFSIPILNLLSKNSSVFSVYKATRLDVLAIALLAVFVLPLLAWGIEAWAGLLLPKIRRYIHAFFIGVALGIYALQFMKHALSPSPTVLIVAGVASGLAAALLRLRSQTFASFIAALAFAPALLAIWFIFFSNAYAVTKQVSFDDTKIAVSSPHRIALIALDELPIGSLLDSTGHVDKELFPSFAALEQSSTFYRNMSTVAPITQWAIPALLTGQYPDESHLPIAADHPDSIFRLLSSTYRMNAHDEITDLCPSKYCPNIGVQRSLLKRVQAIGSDGFNLWRSTVSLHEQIATYSPPEETSKPFDDTRRFIKSIRRDSRPVFDYAHIMLPHQPWVYLNTFQTHRPTSSQTFENSNSAEWTSLHNAELGREIHLLQLQTADTFIGQVIDRLKKVGAWEDTILVVTADHGISFSAGESQRAVSRNNAHEILFPPLFIKSPNQSQPIVDDRAMRTIDVLPTIAEIIGARIPWRIDGKPATAIRDADEPIRLYQFKNPIWDTPLVASGSDYLTFQRSTNKAAISMTASNYAGDPAIRIYRVGEYGGLLSQEVTTLPITPASKKLELFVPGLGANPLNAFNPYSPNLDQTWLEGYSKNLGKNSTIAFAINGRIAGLGFSSRFPNQNVGYYFAQLAPSLINAGDNSIEAFEVTGPVSAPLLTPIQIG